MKNCRQRNVLKLLLLTASSVGLAPYLAAQAQPPPGTSAVSPNVSQSVDELTSEVRQLKELVLELQRQANDSRAEIMHLRQDLEASRAGGSRGEWPGVDEQSAAHEGAPQQLQQRVTQLEEDQQLLSGKVDEQYQTKLESASKYRVRFSGIVLFNLFSNSGSVDNFDVPMIAQPPGPLDTSGAVGGTMRQSILGFEVFGPEFLGAHTSGNLNLDFGGGFPMVWNGVDSGLARLRTAALRLDWKNTSLVAGQDQLFISPNEPTSYASLIVPPLAYAGNLWAWTPQIRVEHRLPLSNDATVTLQGGILDPLTGELPPFEWYRVPSTGERSRAPAIAGRVAYSRPFFGHPFTVGASGYYSRQNWGFGRNVNAWAGLMDWNVPLSRKFSLSGLFYRGSALGGLGGAIGRSVVWNADLTMPTSSVLPINAVGGWAQLKYRATPKVEFNAAFGLDNSFAADVLAFGDLGQSYGDPTLTRNLGGFGNVIYRPRSDLLLSLEYRRLKTYNIYDSNWAAGQLNLGMGVLF